MSGADRRLSTVERAYQLARSGDCRGIDEIRTKLIREGHESVQAHLSGPTLRRELTQLCKRAPGSQPTLLPGIQDGLATGLD